MNLLISSTYIKEMDMKIYSEVLPETLLYLCQTNKYIKSICSIIWKIKINELYPHFPIPTDYLDKLPELYFKISESYVQLEAFARSDILLKDFKILDWLNFPINKVNYLVEFNPIQSVEFPTMGSRARARMQRSKELEEYFESGIYPTQKSINIAMSVGNDRVISRLINYGFFPNQESINIAMEKGYYCHKLSKYHLFPNQKSINIATEKGHYSEELHIYKIFPDQHSINIAAENGHDLLIYVLAGYGKYPDQYAINIASQKGYLEMIELLAQHNKFPSQ